MSRNSRSPRTRRDVIFLISGTVMLSAFITAGVFLAERWNPHRRAGRHHIQSDVSGFIQGIFARDYPASDRLRDELTLLRKQGRLTTENEKRIKRMVVETSSYLRMPPSLLWCLLFQESRLNHLEGIHADRGARGLGQFSHFSFFEVNHHLTRFTDDNLFVMEEILGKDIRPIAAYEGDIAHPSSYFYIPTAVVSSAAFLNNRYLHLRKLLDRQNFSYDPDIAWLLSTMAYNKGGRSVLVFMNTMRRKRGSRELARTLADKELFFSSVTDPVLLSSALRRIWPPTQASEYSRELKIHMESIRDCSIGPPPARELSRKGAREK